MIAITARASWSDQIWLNIPANMSYNINDTCHTNEIPCLEHHYYTGWSIIMNQSIQKLLNKMKSEKSYTFTIMYLQAQT